MLDGNYNLDENLFNEEFKAMQDQGVIFADKPNSKKSVKVLITSIVAVVLAATTAITCFVVGKKKKDTQLINDSILTTDVSEDLSGISIDELGVELTTKENENNKQYGSTTGDVDKNKVVEKDGTIYVDKEAADKSNEVGKVTIDDNNGKYDVTDGKVTDKETGYEIIDEEGNVIASGSSTEELPDGYVTDEEFDDKYVVVDSDYYDKNGVLIISKGEIVSKETFDRIKNDSNLTTIKPEETPKQEEPTTEKTTVVVEHGVVNSNGTYTIYGVTYKSKEDYQQFLLHPEQYGSYNGIVMSIDEIEALYSQKTR